MPDEWEPAKSIDIVEVRIPLIPLKKMALKAIMQAAPYPDSSERMHGIRQQLPNNNRPKSKTATG